MPRRRRRDNRRYYDDDYNAYRPRRRGCLAGIQRFFRNVAIIALVVTGSIALFLLVRLIALNFAFFAHIFPFALFVGGGLTVLCLLYLVVRIISAISHRISAASLARSQARIERERVRMERERVHQARNQVQLQQSRLAREEYLFYRKDLQGPRKTRILPHRDDFEEEDEVPQRVSRLPLAGQQPRRTRVLIQEARDETQQPLARVPNPTVGQEQQIEPEPKELAGMPRKGQVFSYREYQHLLKPGQLIAGIRRDGTACVRSWDDFKILLILGSSASGKTTTIVEKCLCVAHKSGQLVICDPHAMKPDSLTRRIAALQGALMPSTMMAMEHDDIMNNIQAVHDELERRRRGAPMETPIFLVIEEVNRLMRDKQIAHELSSFIEELGQEARGYNIFGIVCAQRATGLADIRNSIISIICHRVQPMESSKCIPARYARLTGELGVGQTFVIDADGTVEALQQVLVREEDVMGNQNAAARSRPTEPLTPRVYGAPRLREIRQQKLVLRQETQPAVISPQPDATTSPLSPSKLPSGEAPWGDTQPIQPPSPITEEFVPSSSSARQKTPQDEFDLLAERRSKKQKQQP